MTKETICTYCGKDMIKDKEKHLQEVAAYLQKLVEECLDVINNLMQNKKR